MEGARKYATMFKTGQYGKLYLVSSHHARGKTFRIYVIPEGEDAKPNGDSDVPRRIGLPNGWIWHGRAAEFCTRNCGSVSHDVQRGLGLSSSNNVANGRVKRTFT